LLRPCIFRSDDRTLATLTGIDQREAWHRKISPLTTCYSEIWNVV